MAARCSAPRPLKMGIAESAPSKRARRSAVDATTTLRNVTRSTPHSVPGVTACMHTEMCDNSHQETSRTGGGHMDNGGEPAIVCVTCNLSTVDT